MKLPTLQGIIRRRILVNYRVAPETMQAQLPAPFRPKLHQGFAIGGICLIRLEQIRPHGMPALIGLSSENAAHRIAVLWEDEDGKTCEGVFVPRRDTNSRLNQLAGGRLFPGEHHAAKFEVRDEGGNIEFAMRSADGETAVEVRASEAALLPPASAFRTLAEASDFFKAGSLGYSTTAKGTSLDGIILETATWEVRPLDVQRVHSSFFSDAARFPDGSATFDCALLMRDIEHEWHSAPSLCL
jgi:hypothetical protein